jgi:hypothetical protein
MDKLGVKRKVLVQLDGKFDARFLAELAERGALLEGRKGCDLIFVAAQKTADLKRVAKLAGAAKPGGALWVVHPKGGAAIREIEVIEAGRAAGWKDVKAASFSATHTARKFVLPLTKRAKGGK